MNKTLSSTAIASETDAAALCVHIVPHPFAVEHIQHRLPAGLSVAAILARLQPDPRLEPHAHIYLDGHYLPKSVWPRMRPKPGTTLTIRMVPMGGGGGKNPLRTVLSMAIAAASPMLVSGLTGYLGAAQASFLGINAGRLITTGINLLGRLALNALAPPARPRFAAGQKESPTLFLQGARNQTYPFGRVPKVLGKHRFVPPLGAFSYTETVGNDQYLRMLFVWGYGPLHISDIKIGETPLSQFSDVEIETREGYDTDAPLTLYSNSVLQNDMDVRLLHADGYAVRTTENDADEISVDITLPQGLLKFSKNGTKKATDVQIEIQYAPAGTGNWSAGAKNHQSIPAQTITLTAKPSAYAGFGGGNVVTRIDRIVLDAASGLASVLTGTTFRTGLDAGAPSAPILPPGQISLALVERRSNDADIVPADRISDTRTTSTFQGAGNFAVSPGGSADQVSVATGGLAFAGVSLTGKQSAAIRKSVSFRVPRGQYDVRVRRLTPDAVDDNTFDTTVWTALRTVRHKNPVNMRGIAVSALRIKATDQLNGVIDRFNGVVHSVLPDWNGSAWVPQVTSNPAALFRHILQGSGNARALSDSRIDAARLEQWHENCAAAGHEFNGIIDYDVSVREALQDVAAAGRASPTLLDGKWAVIEDRPQNVPVQHFTPHNTFGFQGRKAFDEVPQALRARFINRAKGWLQDERLVYDDGYSAETATRYETLDLTGITDAEQAWKAGRYHIATARLRPESYSFYCDLEHIVCTRGDLIRFTHDVPMFGLSSARITAVIKDGGNVTGVTLNDSIVMESGKSYALRIRKADGGSVVKTLATVSGRYTSVNFSAAFSESEGIENGNLVMFGESGQESVELVVRAIEPQNNLNARITCVDAAPEIHNADKGAIPAFNSHISLPADLSTPPAPILAQIQSGEECLIRHTDGSLTTRILVTLTAPAVAEPLSARVLIRAQDETDYHLAEVTAQSATQISITDVTEQETYDIQIRYVTSAGVHSAPLDILGHRVSGTDGIPSDVQDFNMNILGDTAHLSWSAARDVDLGHYTLRFSPQTAGISWSNAIDIISSIPRGTTSVSVPAAAGTYLIKAVDTGGRVSQNAAIIVSDVAGLAGYNAVLDIADEPAFSGTHELTDLLDGALALGGADSIDEWPDIDAVESTDLGNAGLSSAGIYYFAQHADLGAVYTSRLTADLSVMGLDLSNGIDAWTDIDSREDWDDDIDPALWSAALQLRTTADDPSGAPVWSSWASFVVGDYTARAFEFRLVLTSAAAFVTPAVSMLRVHVDMPDRTAAGRDILSLADGSTIAFSTPFRAVPAIAVTAYDMQTGDYYAITSPTASGFDIRFFNAGGSGIARSFDYLAKGYGEQA